MLNFQLIEKSKIEEYKKYYDYAEALGCEFNFVSGYLWSKEYSLKIAFYDDTLIKAYFKDDTKVWGYCLPSGKNVRGAIEAVFRDAAERGQQPQFGYMSKSERVKLETLYPSRFTFERDDETQDYIYLTEDLVRLEGKKYHAKRNHISRFYREYEDTSFRTLDASNISDAMQVVEEWCVENGYDINNYGEYDVIREALLNFEELHMQGAVLYVDQKPIAMTLGSEISPQCFDINFEKALREYNGSYAVINNEFAKTLTAYKYINREEDLGLEGLRKAKLSYNPIIIYDRFTATLK